MAFSICICYKFGARLPPLCQKPQKNEQYGGISISDWHFADRNRDIYLENIKKFCKIIKKWYGEERIIFVSLHQADFGYDGSDGLVKPLDDYKKNGISDIVRRKRENAIIELGEKIVREELSNCWVIDTPMKMLADERHHFGLHPLHYHRMIYDYLAENVMMIAEATMGQRDISLDAIRKKVKINSDMKKYYLNMKIEECFSKGYS